MDKQKTTVFISVVMYLLAVVLANLLVVFYGPSISIINAFFLIGLDITLRDVLHDKWEGKNLYAKMLLLIVTGSIISVVINSNAGIIAIASSIAFLLAGLVDTITYQLLGKHGRMIKINGSNVASSIVDSITFPIIAFGIPVMWGIVIGQFLAKVLGGFVWSIVINRLNQFGK